MIHREFPSIFRKDLFQMRADISLGIGIIDGDIFSKKGFKTYFLFQGFLFSCNGILESLFLLFQGLQCCDTDHIALFLFSQTIHFQ